VIATHAYQIPSASSKNGHISLATPKKLSFNGRNGSVQEYSEQVDHELYDPFADLMMMQDSRPAHLEQLDLRTVSPFQRALLAIDGTVTKFVEAYVLEPVEVTLLKQETQALSQEHSWLEASVKTEVVARQVLLRGRYSGTPYAYAVSLLLPDRLPENMLNHLQIEPSGIGRVLLNSQIENRREILWYGHEIIQELPPAIQSCVGSDFISRTYRIIANDKPIMLISEKFPVDSGPSFG